MPLSLLLNTRYSKRIFTKILSISFENYEEEIHSYQWSVSNLFSSLLEQLLREDKKNVSIDWKSGKPPASLKQKLILLGLHGMAEYIRTADAAYLQIGMKHGGNLVVHNGDFVNGILGKGHGSYEQMERRKESFDKTFKVLVIDEQTNFDAEVEELCDQIYRDLKQKVKGFD